MKSTQIPQEIWDQIIGCIDDTESLQACSITCRRWVRASQSQLFSDLVPSRGMRSDSLIGPLLVVLDGSAHLRSYIKRIAVDVEILTRFSHLCLQNVHSLAVKWPDRAFEEKFDWAAIKDGLAVFPGLRKLMLLGGTVCSGQLTLFLRSLPLVPQLDLRMDHMRLVLEPGQQVPPPIMNPTSIPLIGLHVNDSFGQSGIRIAKHIIRLCDEGEVALNLEKLSIEARMTVSNVGVTNFLLRRSAGVRSFRFVPVTRGEDGSDYSGECFDFSTNRSLKTMVYRLQGGGNEGFEAPVLHMRRSLRTLRSQAFESLILNIIPPWDSEEMRAFYEKLHLAVDSTEFSQLMLLIVGYRARNTARNRGAEMANLPEQLSESLKKRGVVVQAWNPILHLEIFRGWGI